MLLRLQEPYKTIGLQKIAEHTVSTMNLHILSLLALFQREAMTEDISPQERAATLTQIHPVIFQVVDQLSKDLSLSSLDDLAVLSNIVISLQTLSQTHSAQDAQSWLYELPTICYQQLAQEHLLVETQRITVTVRGEPIVTAHQNWLLYSTSVKTLSVSLDDIQVSYASSAKRLTSFSAPARWKHEKGYLAYTA